MDIWGFRISISLEWLVGKNEGGIGVGICMCVFGMLGNVGFVLVLELV